MAGRGMTREQAALAASDQRREAAWLDAETRAEREWDRAGRVTGLAGPALYRVVDGRMRRAATCPRYATSYGISAPEVARWLGVHESEIRAGWTLIPIGTLR